MTSLGEWAQTIQAAYKEYEERFEELEEVNEELEDALKVVMSPLNILKKNPNYKNYIKNRHYDSLSLPRIKPIVKRYDRAHAEFKAAEAIVVNLEKERPKQKMTRKNSLERVKKGRNSTRRSQSRAK